MNEPPLLASFRLFQRTTSPSVRLSLRLHSCFLQLRLLQTVKRNGLPPSRWAIASPIS